MLQNAYFLAKIGAGTAENERNFAKREQVREGTDPVRDLRRGPVLGWPRRSRPAAPGGISTVGEY